MPANRPGQRTRPADWRRKAGHLLKHTFGLPRLRDAQGEVIERVMGGEHALAVMPTGAGKSLCYQLPALLLPGCTVVVSPLIALMQDQCDKLRALGVTAHRFHSGLPAAEAHEANAAIEQDSARVIFTTPEHLAHAGFMAALQRRRVSLLVIDEAHCMSQWGHDFRPAFLEIGAAWPALGKPTVLALTATATPDVARDIVSQLNVPGLQVLDAGAYRPNLYYMVEQFTDEAGRLSRLVALLGELEGAGIVYTATIKAAEAVHEALAAAGIAAALYHGRLGAAERSRQQESFMATGQAAAEGMEHGNGSAGSGAAGHSHTAGETAPAKATATGTARVMVATNAFGLGIDKADTRFVVHYQMPGGLDAYYQESGRAGRDGQPAQCILLYSHRDKAVQQFLMSGRYPGQEEVAAACALLQAAGTPMSLAEVQAAADMPRNKLRVALKLLRDAGVVKRNRRQQLSLATAPPGAAEIERMVRAYQDKSEHDRELLERMVFYARTGFCRWRVLLEHFEEELPFDRCHHCDNCLKLDEAEARAKEAGLNDTAAPDMHEQPQADAEPDAPSRWHRGDAVRVPRHGPGEVVAVDAQSVSIAFPDGHTRSFVPDYVEPA